jgi:hypothetical protein
MNTKHDEITYSHGTEHFASFIVAQRLHKQASKLRKTELVSADSTLPKLLSLCSPYFIPTLKKVTPKPMKGDGDGCVMARYWPA